MIVQRFPVLRFVFILLIVAIPATVFAGPVGKAVGGGSYIEWQMAVGGYDRVLLTVSGPDGEVYSKEFTAGSAVAFNLKDLPNVLDGAYSYQLTVVPRISDGVKRQLEDARKAGDEAGAKSILKKAGLGEAVVQSGGFTINEGSIVAPDRSEGREVGGIAANAVTTPRTTSPVRPGTPVVNDQVIPDDLIVQGSECVGLDCVNNENFGFDTIRLKENNTRIHFDDTSTSAGFPANDWRLIANDSASGGSSKFSIEDSTGAKTPFTVTAGAATNSIFVDSTGRVGLRTSTPVLDLHINTSNTPAIRLEQNNSGGFTAQTWDIGANEANFFVRDVTGGSRLSFRIRPGAPTSSVDISADGDVGVGTASPAAALDVTRTLGALGTILRISNNSGIQLLFDRTDASSTDWQMSNFNTTFQISVPGAGTPQFSQNSNGNLTIAGTLTELSSREAKQNFNSVDSLNVLQKVVDLPITMWSYKQDPNVRHIGPMAEDFHKAFNVGDTDKGIAVTDRTGVAFAAIQGLHQELTAKQAEIDRLAKENADLAARLTRLEEKINQQ